MKRDKMARKPEFGLFEALLQAKKSFGKSFKIVEDQDRKPLDYNTFILGTLALSQVIKRHIGQGERVGIMLPTAVGGAITFFALHALKRVPVMINFTAGQGNIKSAIDTAQVKVVLTARKFILNAKLEYLAEHMGQYVKLVYLEDLRDQMTAADKAFAVAASTLPDLLIPKAKPSDIGVILFTSGSFGLPRGVVLTHANLIANTNQVHQHIELSRDWTLFCPLPIFHSMGMIAGIILPILTGIKTFLYPSPLHIKQIPPLLKSTKASVFFATDTFLNQYAKVAEKDDFSTLEFIVCGAEKVREETRTLFKTDFGVTLIEGYGVTETSPVLALNTPLDNRPGLVGKVLPDIQTRIDAVDGINDGGRLFVKGPNIMAGYIDPNAPDLIETPPDGWHDTGDIVSIDNDGYIKILGRAKRFAKIAGEMVSLTAVERIAEQVWPENRHAVVAIKDDKKGERLVLITDYIGAEISPLADFAKKQGMPNLAVPRTILKLEMLPVLGSGKTDYVTLQRMAEAEAV